MNPSPVGVLASSGASTRWSGSMSSTWAMRLADALALLIMMKMRLTPITPCSTMLKYVRNARITPGLICPLSTLAAPSHTTSVSPMLRHICISGPGMAMMVLALMSARVMASLLRPKRRFSYSILDSAFTTRMPEMSSRITRTTSSRRSCTLR